MTALPKAKALIPLLALCFGIGMVQAADERFEKTAAEPLNGFLTVDNASYKAECGSCHFAYSPGLLPERSWKWMMSTLDKHFGESVKIAPATQEALTKYLSDNAADKSKYEGSIYFMVRISDSVTPKKVTHVPYMITVHKVLLETIARSNKIEPRRLTNCNACHTRADEGSFGQGEVVITGLPWGTGLNVKPR